MNDKSILEHIQTLVEEEHALLEGSSKSELPEESHARLKSLEIELDQCWDLLRQRRARREFGENPDAAHLRDASTVERYQQ